MKIKNYISEKGVVRAIQVIWRYKIDKWLRDIIVLFVKNIPLKNIIIIESHNDFDCNGGAFYNYLLKNGFNKKYRIVWLLKHPDKKPKHLPPNVECYPIYTPNIKKDVRICTAKFLLADNVMTEKKQKNQISVYLGHGTGGLKNIKGLTKFDDNCDYVLIQSRAYSPIQAEQYSLTNTPEKMIFIGYPIHDELMKSDKSELLKVTVNKYDKVILWMPTFRKGIAFRRDDGGDTPLGIPLIKKNTEYEELNKFLAKHNALLIIKIHPMQDLKSLSIKDTSNIIILTAEDVKEKEIDNYRLMRCTDALISDYSGAAYDYLQLNRPIGYILNDMDEYKLGFVVEDIHSLLAGPEIYTFEDMLVFLNSVINNEDNYSEKRNEIRNYIYEYHDSDNCKRLADFLKL